MNNRNIIATLTAAAVAAFVLPISALAYTETMDGIVWTYTVFGGEEILVIGL